jgi:uncharacterized PurR-regulated membrane protein YhhQ (DUF165 family)
MSKKLATVLAYGFAAILVLVGLGFFASDVPVTRMCRRDCWFNELLNLMFGDRVAKALIGSIFLLLAVGFIGLVRRKGSSPND